MLRDGLLIVLDLTVRNLPLLWLACVTLSLIASSRFYAVVAVVVAGPLANALLKRLPWPSAWALRPGGGRSLVAGTSWDYGCGWIPGRCSSAAHGFPSGHAQTAAALAVWGGEWTGCIVVALVVLQRLIGKCHTGAQLAAGVLFGTVLAAASGGVTGTVF